MDPIWHDLALRNGSCRKVSVHSDISSVWKPEPIYLVEMENGGPPSSRNSFYLVSRGNQPDELNVPTITDELKTVLQTYPNLSIDLSWVVFDKLSRAGRKNWTTKWVGLIE